MCSTTVRSGAERLAGFAALVWIAACSGPDPAAAPAPAAPATEATGDASDPLDAGPAEGPGTDAASEDAQVGDRDDQATASGDQVAAAEDPTAETDRGGEEAERDAGAGEGPDGIDAVAALLSGYESGPPARAQLEATASDPLAVLLRLAGDDARKASIRHRAVRALGFFWGPDARAHTVGLMNDEGAERGLRRAAVQAAAPNAAGDDEVRPIVEARLRDPDAAVARAAVLGLADVGPSRGALQTLDAEEVPGQVRTALDQVLRGGVDPAASRPPVAVPVEPAKERPGRR